MAWYRRRIDLVVLAVICAVSWLGWLVADEPALSPLQSAIRGDPTDKKTGLAFWLPAAVLLLWSLCEQPARTAVWGWIGAVAVIVPLLLPMRDGYWWMYPPLSVAMAQSVGLAIASLGELLSRPPPPTT